MIESENRRPKQKGEHTDQISKPEWADQNKGKFSRERLQEADIEHYQRLGPEGTPHPSKGQAGEATVVAMFLTMLRKHSIISFREIRPGNFYAYAYCAGH